MTALFELYLRPLVCRALVIGAPLNIAERLMVALA
jgi:hypothetical protein